MLINGLGYLSGKRPSTLAKKESRRKLVLGSADWRGQGRNPDWRLDTADVWTIAPREPSPSARWPMGSSGVRTARRAQGLRVRPGNSVVAANMWTVIVVTSP